MKKKVEIARPNLATHPEVEQLDAKESVNALALTNKNLGESPKE